MTREPGYLEYLADTPEFVNAWEKVLDEPLTYQEFSELPMPPHCSSQELWHLFSTLRRCSGTVMHLKPYFEASGDVSWISFPQSMEKNLNTLTSLSNPSSMLNAYLGPFGNNDFELISFVVEEVSSLAKRDGITLPRETIRNLFRRNQNPQTPAERIIVNLAAILEDPERYAKRQFTSLFLDDVHQALIEGTGELEELKARPHLNLKLYRADRVDNPLFVEEMIASVLKGLRDMPETTNPVIMGCELSFALWDLGYYPSLNALTEYIVRRSFFMKRGYTILAYVPFSYISENVNNSFVDDFETEFEDRRSKIGTEEGIDCTLLYAGAIKTYLKGALRIKTAIEGFKDQEERYRERIYDIEGLNRRQRDFLIVAMKNPAVTFKMQNYRALYDVAYATARHDLFDLAERGFLSQRKMGKAFAFQGIPETLRLR